MKILIVDDDDARHQNFASRFADRADLYHAYGYPSAVDALDRSVFDLILLDHDLCIASTESCGPYGRELTGQDVARYIAELPKVWRPKQIIVHSWNAAGAKAIMRILQAAGFKPIYDPFPVKSLR